MEYIQLEELLKDKIDHFQEQMTSTPKKKKKSIAKEIILENFQDFLFDFQEIYRSGTYFIQSSNNMMPLADIYNGGLVGYSEVTIRNIDSTGNNNIGKTKYEYINKKIRNCRCCIENH